MILNLNSHVINFWILCLFKIYMMFILTNYTYKSRIVVVNSIFIIKVKVNLNHGYRWTKGHFFICNAIKTKSEFSYVYRGLVRNKLKHLSTFVFV